MIHLNQPQWVLSSMQDGLQNMTESKEIGESLGGQTALEGGCNMEQVGNTTLDRSLKKPRQMNVSTY